MLNEVRSLDQDARGALRRAGVRFGAYHLYLPALLKPAPRTLATQLWALRNGGLEQPGIDEIAHLVGPHLDPGRSEDRPRTLPGGGVPRLRRPRGAGRHPGASGRPHPPRHRLSSRHLPGEPPPGAADADGFVGTVAMTSLVGCAGEDFASILKSLGYAASRPGPAITVPLVPAPRAVAPPAPAFEPAGSEAGPAADATPAGAGEGWPEKPRKQPSSPSRRLRRRSRPTSRRPRRRGGRTCGGSRSRIRIGPARRSGGLAAETEASAGAEAPSAEPAEPVLIEVCASAGGITRVGVTEGAVPSAASAATAAVYARSGDRSGADGRASAGRTPPGRAAPWGSIASALRESARPGKTARGTTDPVRSAARRLRVRPRAAPTAGRPAARTTAADRATTSAGGLPPAPGGTPREAARSGFCLFAKLLALKAQLEDPNGGKR